MDAGLHPVELKATIPPDREIAEVRNLFCPRYDDCLDQALAFGWASWSCAGCPGFVHATLRAIDGFANPAGAARRRARAAAAAAPAR